MGIKIKKKKKFRRWQKNSGAIFEKEGVIMGWWTIVKSSRNEAYAVFLEQYGPEQNYEKELYVGDDESGKLIVGTSLS